MYLLVVTAASQNESLSKALNAPWQINLIAKIEMPHRGFTGCQAQGAC